MSHYNPELSLVVGDIAIASASLEQGVADFLCVLLGNRPVVNTLITGLSFDQLIQSCNAVLKQSEPRPFVTRSLDAMKVAKTAWQERSRVIHARWARNTDDGHFYSFRERRWTIALESLQWDMEDIVDVLRQIVDASAAVGKCVSDFFDKPVHDDDQDLGATLIDSED